MKKLWKRISLLLLTVAMVCAVPCMAYAAESTITYKGHKVGYEFEPGSEYTDTDLFENFKEVMPGDVRSEVVTFKNEYKGSDYIKVWMSALLHDEDGNPISAKVLEELKADERNTTMSEVEYMHDFLSQLTLTVWNGEKTETNIVYKGSPNSLEMGFEGDNVYLGRINKGSKLTLNVELAVDIEMGNEYANRIGEVDWIFLVEERDNPDDSNNPGGGGGKDPSPKPTPEDTVILIPSDPPLSDFPVDVLDDYVVVPKTGDETVVLPYLLLFGCGVLGMVLMVFGKRKRTKNG